MHKNSNGASDYLYFRIEIPKRMRRWAERKNINNHKELVDAGVDMLAYLNQLFIKDNADLFMVCSDINVYKSKYTIAHYMDNGSLHTTVKAPKEMLVEDIRNMDVWEKQTVEVDSNRSRDSNKVPIWQKSMNVRHYDRNNEGLAHSVKNSSLEGKPYGYGDAINVLYELAAAKLKKMHSVNSYE